MRANALIVLAPCQTLFQALILKFATTLWDRDQYYPYFIDEEPVAQRGQVTYPVSHNWEASESGFEAR